MELQDETRNFILNLIPETSKKVKKKISKNNNHFNYRESFFQLKSAVDKILEEDSDDRYFLMAGLRGVGKTTILFQIYDYLFNEKGITAERLLYLDLSRAKNIPEFDLQKSLDFFIEEINEDNIKEDKPIFIFVDESQYDSNWSMCGKIIYDEQNKVFAVFTGSDALNLESNQESARRALKINVPPLNFREYLHLKYDVDIDNKGFMEDMLLFGDIENAVKIENKINYSHLLNKGLNTRKTFEYYLQYGGFPFCIGRDKNYIVDLTIDLKDRIIEKDLDLFSNFTSSSRRASYQLINFLATQKPADVSISKLANILNISKETVSSILSAFEKTHLIFHIEPYGSSSKRIRKSWEYYFLAPQVKAAIYLDYGQAYRNKNEYMGLLAENMVASSLFKIKKNHHDMFSIFYDSRKGGVDFLINDISGNIIPIEVGYGKKNKKQIKSAINKYNSEFGLVVSNRTQTVEKEDNVIFVPLHTFALI